MLKYRLIYGITLSAIVAWFVFDNTAISFAMLLTWILFPIALHLWMRLEIRTFQIKIGFTGSMCVSDSVHIRIAVVGKHNASIGRICGNVSFYHAVLDELEEKECWLFNRGNLFAEDVGYKSAACGVVRVRVKQVKVYDCLGLTHCGMKGSAADTFVLYPDESDFEMNNIPQWNGEEFIGVRKYREGDVMSAVHWKLSGKWDELYVREYAEEEQSDRNPQMNKKCQTCTFYDLCYNK